MWFRVLSLVIGVALLSKAATALAAPRRFYAERQRQYASASQPASLFVAPVVILGVTSAAPLLGGRHVSRTRCRLNLRHLWPA